MFLVPEEAPWLWQTLWLSLGGWTPLFPGEEEEEVVAAMVAAITDQRERRRGEEEYAVTRRWECSRTVGGRWTTQ